MSILADRTLPVNPEALAAARQKRLESAKREAASYTIYQVNDHTLYVLNPATGRVSTVTKDGASVHCDCPDHVQNGAALGTCKHIAACCLNKTRYPLPPLPKPQPTASERLARMDRLDFNAGRWLGDR